jgi:hypothetical protein
MIAIAILATVTCVTTLVAYSYFLREQDRNEHLTIELEGMTESRDGWVDAYGKQHKTMVDEKARWMRERDNVA